MKPHPVYAQIARVLRERQVEQRLAAELRRHRARLVCWCLAAGAAALIIVRLILEF